MNSLFSIHNIKLSSKQVHITCIVYALLTIVCLWVLSYFSWCPIQIRISEALCVIAVISSLAIPELAFGCMFANIVGMAMFNLWPIGLLDAFLGSLATLLGAIWAWKFRDRNIIIALFGFVLFNALIIGAYLPFVADSAVYYHLFDLSFDSSYIVEYAFGAVSIGISEALIIYGVGLIIIRILQKYCIKD